MVRSHDVGTPARECLENAGLSSLSILREVGADGFDIEALKPTIKEIQRKWKHLKKETIAQQATGKEDK